MKKTIVLALLGLVLLPGRVAAQSIRTPYEFVDENQSAGVTAGYIFADPGAVGLGPASAPYYGVRYAIRINGPFVLEGTAAHFGTTRTIVAAERENEAWVTRGEAALSLLLLQAALRFDLTGPRTWYNLMPYLLVGGGAVIPVRAEQPELEPPLPVDARFRFGTSFAGQLGGGVEWLAARNLGIQADFRNYLWRLTTPSAFLEVEDVPAVPSEQWTQNLTLSAGLVIRF
jgi:hypothetical protein